MNSGFGIVSSFRHKFEERLQLSNSQNMKKFTITGKYIFLFGMLCGSFMSIVSAFLLLMPYISFEGHGVLLIRKFPQALNIVTFENNLVDITIGEIGFSKKDDMSFMIKCKNPKFGQISGSAYENQFLFRYMEPQSGYVPKYINDHNNLFHSAPRKVN